MRSASRFSKSRCATAVLMSVFALGVHAQQIYRIVGPDGRVTFSDQPPAAAARGSNQNGNGNGNGNANEPAPATTASSSAAVRQPATLADGLPYGVRQIVLRYPVTFYTTKDCQPCVAARDLLVRRGIPFIEKTIETSADNDALKKISGDTSLPFASVGSQYLKGFSETEWTDYFNAAGYPKESALPSSYRRPAPEPLVALQKTVLPNNGKSEKDAQRSLGAGPNNAHEESPEPAAPAIRTPANPSGIQF